LPHTQNKLPDTQDSDNENQYDNSDEFEETKQEDTQIQTYRNENKQSNIMMQLSI